MTLMTLMTLIKLINAERHCEERSNLYHSFYGTQRRRDAKVRYAQEEWNADDAD